MDDRLLPIEALMIVSTGRDSRGVAALVSLCGVTTFFELTHKPRLQPAPKPAAVVPGFNIAVDWQRGAR